MRIELAEIVQHFKKYAVIVVCLNNKKRKVCSLESTANEVLSFDEQIRFKYAQKMLLIN